VGGGRFAQRASAEDSASPCAFLAFALWPLRLLFAARALAGAPAAAASAFARKPSVEAPQGEARPQRQNDQDRDFLPHDSLLLRFGASTRTGAVEVVSIEIEIRCQVGGERFCASDWMGGEGILRAVLA